MIPTLPPDGAPRAVVTGTGRCGTGYIRTLLVANGVNAGHECWFAPDGMTDRERIPDTDIDVSWLALPYIENGYHSGPVVHILRDPVACVRSLVGTQHLTHPTSVFTRFAHDAMPRLIEFSPIVQAVEFWVEWNHRIADCGPVCTLRVEETLDHLGELADALGVGLDMTVSGDVPTNVHTRPEFRADIDHTMIWELLDGRADEFGYKP